MELLARTRRSWPCSASVGGAVGGCPVDDGPRVRQAVTDTIEEFVVCHLSGVGTFKQCCGYLQRHFVLPSLTGPCEIRPMLIGNDIGYRVESQASLGVAIERVGGEATVISYSSSYR